MVMFSKLKASTGMWLCSSDTPVACLMIFRLIPGICLLPLWALLLDGRNNPVSI